MSNTKSRGRGRNHERVKASSKITKKRHIFLKRRGTHYLGKQMLTDEFINIEQSLLSRQFPKICGFEDTVIGKLQEFDVIPTEKKYIQILHDLPVHWVCIANMESRKKDNEICLKI